FFHQASLQNHIKIHDDTIDKLLWEIAKEKEKNRRILCQSNEDHFARESLMKLDVQLEDDEGEIGIDNQFGGDKGEIGIDNQLGGDENGIGIDRINSQLEGDEGGIESQLEGAKGGIEIDSQLGDDEGQLESWTEDILEMEEINN
ncbi:7436_t:CDS:2, partial [Racocetra fulgida]